MKRPLLALLIVLTLAACGQSYEEERRLSQAESQRLKTEDSLALKVAVMPTLDCLPLFIAKDHHFFDTLGVDVRLKPFTAQMDCDQALLHGQVEGMVTDSKRMEHMAAQGVALTQVATTDAYWQLVANRKARIKEVRQLGDKMVAMTRHSATDFLTDRALAGVKTSAQVFKVQINDVGVRLQMLRNNEMDAMWLPEPQATAARLEGNPVIKDSRKMGYQLGCMVFKNNAMKDARRQTQLKHFMKAYDMACDSLNHYGLSHYSQLVTRHCHVDENTIRALPKVFFSLSKRKTDINNP